MGLDDYGSARFPVGHVITEIAKNVAMASTFVTRVRKRLFAVQEEPLRTVFEHHALEWDSFSSGLTKAGRSLHGNHVVELGAGPILLNGVRFIANGAASYTALDRYPLFRTDDTIRSTYREFIAHLTAEEQARCQGLVVDVPGTPFDDRIQMRVLMLENARAELPSHNFDLAVSFNFLEHVDDLASVMKSCNYLLKPGGLMIHRVDVSTHAARDRFHPLAQLTMVEGVWRLMGSRRGLPNRIRPSEFLAAAKRSNFATLHYEPTTCLTAETVSAFRPALTKHFRNCATEDLATLDFLWAAVRS